MKDATQLLDHPHAAEAMRRLGFTTQQLNDTTLPPTRLAARRRALANAIAAVDDETKRAKAAIQLSEQVYRVRPAEKRDRTKLTVRHSLQKASLDIAAKIEADALRKRSEAKLAGAEAARTAALRERDARRVEDAARRDELRRLKLAQLDAQRAAIAAKPSPEKRPGTAPSPTSRALAINEELARRIDAAQARKESFAKQREAELVESMRAREQKAAETREARAAAAREAASRRQLLQKQFELRRELHTVIAESSNYDLLTQAQTKMDTASAARRERAEEVIRRAQARKRAQDAATQRRTAAQKVADEAKRKDAQRCEERTHERSVVNEHELAEKHRKREEKLARSRLLLQTQRISEDVNRKMLEEKIERDLGRAEQARRKHITRSASFDTLRRRKALEENMAIHRRREAYQLERTRTAIAAKEERYHELKKKEQQRLELVRLERARVMAMEDEMRAELATKAKALAAAAPSSRPKRALPPGVAVARPSSAPTTARRRQADAARESAQAAKLAATELAQKRKMAAQKRGRAALAIARASRDEMGGLAAVERLRSRQNEELLASLAAEQARESERALLLAQTEGADRERLVKIFECERRAAEEETVELTARHDIELSQHVAWMR